jgi:hypothetical protein
MRKRETAETGAKRRNEADTKSFTTYGRRSTPKPDAIVVDAPGPAIGSASVAVGLPGLQAMMVSESHPMTDRAGKVQWFEPFEIRRRKGVLEIAVRLVQGTIALMLPVQIGFAVAFCITLALGGYWPPLPFPPIVFAVIWIAVLVLGVLMFRLAARRFVYWKVDQAGIHQHWFGFRNWSLSWNEIASRRLGPIATPTWFFFYFVPIAGGEYQPIILEDREGRIREVNRLAKNGDRLDAILRQYLNPTGEAQHAKTYSKAMQTAAAIHSRQEAFQIPIRRCTGNSPVVRMKMHEPQLLPVCCNCLGPAAIRVPIPVSGLDGFFDHTFFRFLIPLCSACHARMRRKKYVLYGRIAIAIALGVVALIAFSLAVEVSVPSHVFYVIPSHPFFAILGPCCIAAILAMLWKEIKRPSDAMPVQVMQASSAGDWMEVRFGNRDYARLVEELNRIIPESRTRFKETANSKPPWNDGLQEL